MNLRIHTSRISMDFGRSVAPNLSPQPRRRHGFTLIELLVVISIIALLIGILLPALAAAREVARSAACLSNQRQLGIGVFTYQGDYDGYYPGWGVALGSSNFVDFEYYTNVLSEGDYARVVEWQNESRGHVALADHVWTCPSVDEGWRSAGYGVPIQNGYFRFGQTPINSTPGSSLARPLMPWVNDPGRGGGPNPGVEYVRVDYVTQPSDTIAMMEAARENPSDGTFRPNFSFQIPEADGTAWDDTNDQPYSWHGRDSVNTSFADGHGGTVVKAEMIEVVNVRKYFAWWE